MQRKKIALLLSAVMIMTAPGLPAGSVYAAEEFQSEAGQTEDVTGEAAEEETQEDTDEIVQEDPDNFAQADAGEDTADDISESTESQSIEDLTSDKNSKTEAFAARQGDTVEDAFSDGVAAEAGTASTNASVTETGSCGTSSTYTLYADGRLVIEGSGAAYHDFSEDTRITDVYVSEGITDLGKSGQSDWMAYELFGYCPNLSSVSLPDSLENIGDYAFRYCSSLKKVTLPDKLKSLGRGAFGGCSDLREITIPGNVTILADDLFERCERLESVTLPDNVTEIGKNTFFYCINLTDINIPQNLTSIGDSAFNYSGITEINLPDTVETIGDGAFCSCSKLQKIKLPVNLKEIKAETFSNCDRLSEIKLPEKLVKIGKRAFAYTGLLSSVTVPDSVTTLEEYAFYNSGIQSIHLPENITAIGDYAFAECGALYDMEFPDKLSSIGYSAFYNCINLTSISLPESLTSIDTDAFTNCTSLREVYVPGSNVTFEKRAIGYGEATYYGFILIGKKSSTTEAYATANNISFHSVDDPLIHYPAKAATCSQEGNNEYWHCNTCHFDFCNAEGTERALFTTIPKSEHKMTFVAYKSPTCTEDGNTGYYHCESCGKNFSDQGGSTEVGPKDIILPSSGHEMSYEEGWEATCIQSGKKASYHCWKCDKYFLDEKGTQEASNSDIVIPQNQNHEMDYEEGWEATCIQSGRKASYRCRRCNKYFLDEKGTQEISESDLVIPQNQNHEMDYEPKIPADCMQEGRKAYYQCRWCRKTFLDKEGTQETEISDLTVNKQDHNLEYHKEIPATCIRSGQKSYYSCRKCGRFFLDKKGTQEVTMRELETSMGDHNWGSWNSSPNFVTPAPMRPEDGKSQGIGNELWVGRYRICTVCGVKDEGNPVIYKLYVNSDYVKLKYGQSTTSVKASGFINGDYLKQVTSNNKKIVTVSSINKNGTFKLTAGKVSGVAIVTLKLNSGVSAAIRVRVEKPFVKTTAITGLKKSVNVVKGKTITLKPALKPSNSQEKITYSSSNKTVATVSTKGVITGKKPGTAKITVKSGSIKTVVTVTVTKVKTTKLTGVPKTKTLRKGKTFTIKAVAAPKNTDEKITYRSSNSKVASVTSKGVVKGLKKGTATITVRSGSKKMTCKVTVK